jgi:hypothetical protein
LATLIERSRKSFQLMLGESVAYPTHATFFIQVASDG